MKKRPDHSGASLLVALIAILLPVSLTQAERLERSQTFRVPSRQFPNIQRAINAAADGDRVLVAPGIYNETLTIAHRIILTGSGKVLAGPTSGYHAEMSAGGVALYGNDGIFAARRLEGRHLAVISIPART